jgi:hypothetical protein
MSYRVTSIRMSSGGSSLEHITDIKCVNEAGTVYQETVAQVVGFLKGKMNYYVSVGNYKVEVTHSTSALGREYIKTKPDATQKDNLLSLPRF